jgi:hypothetical protein
LATAGAFAGLLPKDIITILVSGVALVTSMTIGFINWRIQREKRADDARKAFDDAIGAIQTARADFEKLRHELKDKFNDAAALGPRSVIATRRNYATSRALEAAKTQRFRLGSVDNLLLAAALIDTGRPGAAVPYYKASVALSEDDFDRAVALRVLGRAIILSGSYSDGRDEVLKAAKLFGSLAENRDYDRSRMRDEAAETYRRLIDACLTVDHREYFAIDIPAMLSSAEGLKTPIADTCRLLAERLSPQRAEITGAGIGDVVPLGEDRHLTAVLPDSPLHPTAFG